LKPETSELDQESGAGCDSAAGGCSTSKQQANQVSEYFQYDDPPGVVSFDTDFLSLLRVCQNLFNLGFSEFDFHNYKIFKGLKNLFQDSSFKIQGSRAARFKFQDSSFKIHDDSCFKLKPET
jgi:hypothetical protein